MGVDNCLFSSRVSQSRKVVTKVLRQEAQSAHRTDAYRELMDFWSDAVMERYFASPGREYRRDANNHGQRQNTMVDKTWPQVISSHQVLESVFSSFKSVLAKWFALTNRMWQMWDYVTFFSLPLSLLKCFHPQKEAETSLLKDERPHGWGWGSQPTVTSSSPQSSANQLHIQM